jgi:hypothetical protein
MNFLLSRRHERRILMKNIRPILGAQEPPIPNNAMPECICVPKVFDWVLVSEDIGNFTFTVPACHGCPTTTPVTVSCATSVSPNTPICTGATNATCEIVSIRLANIDGANVKVVTLNVIFNINITISGGGATCTLTNRTVSFKEQLVLCFPDTFTNDNLRCRILTLVCDLVDFIPPTDTTPGSITLELSICKEVQVQAEVKLEVEAKFCQPRPPITPPPLVLCPPVNFPQQCSIFPIPNCNCQGFVSAHCAFPASPTCLANGAVDGLTFVSPGTASLLPTPTSFTQSIVASICSNCSPQNTNITYIFTDTSGSPPDHSFTFRAQGATTVTCTPTTGAVTLLVATGKGTITLANGTVINNVTYTLTLNSGVVPNAWTLTLTDPATTTAFTASGTVGAGDTLTITPCVTLE